MIVSLIAAVDSDNGIGLCGVMPWGSIKEDMAFFRATTVNSTVIMGRVTFESLGSKPLKNRKNIVITRNIKKDTEEVFYRTSLIEVLKESLINKEHQVFIIGGASIYSEALLYADRIYLTHIPKCYNCDRQFPLLDEKIFMKNKISSFMHDDMCVDIIRYDRIKL